MARKRKLPDPTGVPPGIPLPPLPPYHPDDPDRPLDDLERWFADEYLIDRNATLAYRRSHPNACYNTAHRNGYILRHRPNVSREITAAVRAQSIRTQITADKVLKEIARIAFSDVYDLFDPNTHQLLQPRHIPFETRRAVASIRVKRERETVTETSTPGRRGERRRTTVSDSIVSYTLWPKMEALSKIARHLGLDTEITPLESLLTALPRDLAGKVRAALVAPREAGTNGQPKQAGLPATPLRVKRL